MRADPEEPCAHCLAAGPKAHGEEVICPRWHNSFQQKQGWEEEGKPGRQGLQAQLGLPLATYLFCHL